MKEKKHFLQAIATLVGTVIGAGIFAIPYVIAQAGFITGIIDIVLIGLAVLTINLYMGEITLRTPGFHQLSGYAYIYLGKIGKMIMSYAMIFGIYGALTAYMLGEGEALFAIFNVWSPMVFTLIFFAIMAYLLYVGLKAVEESELGMVPIIIIISAIIILLSLFKFDVDNLLHFNWMNVFLPYGVILFAFGGTVSIPEMREVLVKNEGLLKRSIIIGSMIPMAIYAIFSLVVVGVTGIDTTQVATIGLGELIGNHMVIFGNLFVIFAMATSFLALGLALKEMYIFDFKMKNIKAWLLTLVPPLIVVLLGFNSFIKAIQISGSFAFGIEGILIVLMYWRAKKHCGRHPEYKISKIKLLGYALIVLFSLGILYQILDLTGII